MPNSVLIIEDDPNIIKLVSLYLVRDGHKVMAASNGLEGLRLARERDPDLIVLDLMLPGLDGMEICRAIRENSNVPIVMITARVDEGDRLRGLDIGADDYVTKPFSPKELAARVRAVLRRTKREKEEVWHPRLEYMEIKVDLNTRVVQSGSEILNLTPTEFRLLGMLMGEIGRVFTREQIIDRVFGHDFSGFDRTVDAHITNIRRKLEPQPKKPSYIHTVYGIGYRFGDA